MAKEHLCGPGLKPRSCLCLTDSDRQKRASFDNVGNVRSFAR